MLDAIVAAIASADVALFRWLRSHDNAVLDPVMLRTSAFTSGGRLWLVAALLMAALSPVRARAALHVVFAVVLSLVVTDYLAKPFLNRARPFETHVDTIVVGPRPKTSSLPSGHAASAAAGGYALTRVLPRSAAALVWLIAALVWTSRVYLGVHYPADVVVGALLGTAVAVFVVGGTRWRFSRS